MMHARFALILFCALAASSTAIAQDLENSDDGYLAPKLVLGLGGEGEIDIETPLGGVDPDFDLELTYGFGLAYMAPLHEYFALGGQLIVASWQPDYPEPADDVDRNSYVDLSLVPQLKVAVSDNVELYASLPLGLTLDFFGENEFGGAEIETGFGFNLALMLGARFAVGDSWGLLGEIGYVYHSFTHGTSAGDAEGPDLDISLGQIGLNLGVWFSL